MKKLEFSFPWAPKNKEHVDYRRGDIAKLPSHEKTEILTFIGKFKNSINCRSDKFETYKIIREKPNDEESRILELRKFDEGGKLDFMMEIPNRNNADVAS